METLSEKTQLYSELNKKQQCNVDVNMISGKFRKCSYKINCLREVEFRL